MKNMVWLLIALLLFPAWACAKDSLFFAQIPCQPIKLKEGTLFSEDEMEVLISPEGTADRQLIDSVHDELTDGYRIVDMDIHHNRIVMLLETIDSYCIRIAQWNEEEQTYRINNWPDLPEVFLDTYHDGHAVFFEYYEEFPDDFSPVFMVTIEETEDQWHVTRFTDGQTYTAKMTETGYLFCDYYEYDLEEYQYAFLAPTKMGEITWTHLTEMTNEFNARFPLRPALNDAYWDELENM